MLSAITSSLPVSFELPKPSLNSSKDTILTPNDRFEKSIPISNGNYLPSAAKKEESKSIAKEPELDPAKEAWAEVKAWAKVMKEELKQQQAELVKQIIAGKDKGSPKGEGMILNLQLEIDMKAQKSELESPEPIALVPEYWNAENTSDRIVRMATGFAKVSGLSPREFGEKIRTAIEDGFAGAQEITGELPGAAGKLNKDTHTLVFSKLQKWLDDWEATAYNQST